MLHDIDDIIAFSSKYFTLEIGDMIFSGSPAGIAPITIGHEYKGYIKDKCLFTCKIESDGKRKQAKPFVGEEEEFKQSDLNGLKENFSQLDGNLFS